MYKESNHNSFLDQSELRVHYILHVSLAHVFIILSSKNIMIENIFVRVNIKFTATVPLQIFLLDSYGWYAIFAPLNTTPYICTSKQMPKSQSEQQDTINYASTGL